MCVPASSQEGVDDGTSVFNKDRADGDPDASSKGRADGVLDGKSEGGEDGAFECIDTLPPSVEPLGSIDFNLFEGAPGGTI